MLVIDAVREGSQADRIGFRRGLAVLGVDAERTVSEEDLYRALIRRIGRDSVLLAISDGRSTHRVPLDLR